MAPSPENDNAPKAPDKGDKTKRESTTTAPDSRPQDSEISASGPENKEASVSRLDDVELKALLDEAINYKIPKDRVGKSKLFQNLLEKAEEDDRKARATSASGSESVRYYNTTATHRTRRRREPSSISENLTHGGSLNNLAKEELYAVASHLNRPTKTVSTRQRQGGSLPCNVNAGVTPSYDKQFFEEARRKMENKKAEYTAIDMESESLLEHDSLNQDYNEQPEIEVVQTRIPRIPMKYTSRFNLEIGGGGGGSSNVDDSLTVSALERATDKVTDNEVAYKPVETITASTHYPAAHYSLLMPSPIWPFNRKSVEDKKVDENGNALGQSNTDTKKSKKKKIQTDKNVVVLEAKDVAGHRSDIINDLDKLVEYIGGNDEQTGAKSKSNVHKTKFHKHHFGGASGDDKGANKKQRTRSKGKVEKLHKSNSMEEISISKLDDFDFSQECDGNKVPLRSTKSSTDRPRERRSWGNSESLPLHASAENLETADFRVVTKKKKSKKRRNSVSGRRQPYCREAQDNEFNRVPSPEPRRKSACSVPHSDKSNDSSDVDSVHSLPIDTEHLNIDSDRLNSTNLNLPISYADIAKNSNSMDRPKWNRPPSERKAQQTKGNPVDKNLEKGVAVVGEVTESKMDTCQHQEKICDRSAQPASKVKTHSTTTQSVQTSPKLQNFVLVTPDKIENRTAPEVSCPVVKNSLPDVHNIQNWPTIQNNINNNNNKTSVSSIPTNKNNHKIVHSKNSPPNNIKNNLKNVQQHKSEKVLQQHHQQQQQQYIPNLLSRGNNSLPNNIHVEAAVQILQNSEQICVNSVQVLPHNIPDVQTIEKMHFKQLQQAMQQHNTSSTYVPHSVQEIMSNHVTHIPHPYVQTFGNVSPNVHLEQQSGGGGGVVVVSSGSNRVQQCMPMNEVQNVTVMSASESCDSERTSSRPAVVILSGDSKEVSGITFGFDINEQLLSDDVCDNFTARFYVPDIFQNHNHDKIVNFIGLAWEDTISQANGKVKYFSDQL